MHQLSSYPHPMQTTYSGTDAKFMRKRAGLRIAQPACYSPDMARGEPTKTIAHARRGGEKALTVHCLGCYHKAVKTFDELKLWNDMIFVDVPKHRLNSLNLQSAPSVYCDERARPFVF
jgi:hypothetical protein